MHGISSTGKDTSSLPRCRRQARQSAGKPGYYRHGLTSPAVGRSDQQRNKPEACLSMRERSTTKWTTLRRASPTRLAVPRPLGGLVAPLQPGCGPQASEASVLACFMMSTTHHAPLNRFHLQPCGMCQEAARRTEDPSPRPPPPHSPRNSKRSIITKHLSTHFCDFIEHLDTAGGRA